MLLNHIINDIHCVPGSNLLHGVLVQIFLVHQQSSGSFVFSDRLCGVIQVNQAVLQDVPFIIISLQLMVSLQRLKKVNVHFKDGK